MTYYNQSYRADKFISEFLNSDRPKYVLGRTIYAKKIMENFEISGVIDDFTDEKEFCGLPIFKTKVIPDNSMVVSTIIGKPLLMNKKLGKMKFNFMDYFTFYAKLASIKSLEPVMFWDGFIDEYKNNKDMFDKIYNLFADKKSKDIFSRIINFRLKYDLKYMDIFSNRESEQYFEDFLNLSNNETFIDVGGFDGNTSLEFIKRTTGYKSIYFFEPEESNFNLAKKKLKDFKNITMHKLGLGEKKEIVNFSKNGSSSAVSSDGELYINIERLDNLKLKSASFIKMDIEGFELSALNGCEKTIKKYKPKMAISVYHRIDDFWKIPNYILSIVSDYSIYLRHYTEGISETIMFFVPREKI